MPTNDPCVCVCVCVCVSVCVCVLQSIEFETVARIIGHLGIRMSMIAYPVVAINKAMLQSAVNEMRTNPNFKGIL